MDKKLQKLILDELKRRGNGMTRNSLIDHIVVHTLYKESRDISANIEHLKDEGKVEDRGEWLRATSLAHKNLLVEYLKSNWIAITALFISVLALFK